MSSKSETTKKTVKAAESKVEEVNTPVTAAEEPKKAAPKKAAEKKPVEKKTTEKKPAEKKPAEKKPVQKKETAPAPQKTEAASEKPAVKAAPKKAGKEAEASVYIEYLGSQIDTKKVLEDAKKAYAALNRKQEIKTIDLYMKPEEGVAYYVINGEGSDDYKVNL